MTYCVSTTENTGQESEEECRNTRCVAREVRPSSSGSRKCAATRIASSALWVTVRQPRHHLSLEQHARGLCVLHAPLPECAIAGCTNLAIHKSRNPVCREHMPTCRHPSCSSQATQKGPRKRAGAGRRARRTIEHICLGMCSMHQPKCRHTACTLNSTRNGTPGARTKHSPDSSRAGYCKEHHPPCKHADCLEKCVKHGSPGRKGW